MAKPNLEEKRYLDYRKTYYENSPAVSELAQEMAVAKVDNGDNPTTSSSGAVKTQITQEAKNASSVQPIRNRSTRKVTQKNKP